jgi:propanediol dehydratase large subunit
LNKVNPRRKPATQADVERAKRLAVREAARYAWAIVFTVLMDKEHATPEILQRVWSEVDSLSDEIAEGRVSVADLICVLREEYGIELE